MILGRRGPVVVASARVAAMIERVLIEAAAKARRDGLTVDPEAAELIAEVTEVAAWWRQRLPPLPAAVDNRPEVGAESVPMSAADAARVLGIGDRRVRQLAAAGVLKGRREAGRWSFDPADVDAYKEAHDE